MKYLKIEIILGVLILTGSFLSGQEETKPEKSDPQENLTNAQPFEISSIKLRSFEKLTVDLDDAAKMGYVETFQSKSDYLVEVQALISPNWTEDRLKIIIDSKNILLTSKEGKPFPMVGRFNYGFFEKQAWNSFTSYRPTKWAEKNALVPYNVVYLVPKESNELIFKMGAVQKEITLPENISEIPIPADSVTVEYVSGKIVTEIPGGDLSRDVEMQSSIRPLKGPLLEVSLKITPKNCNSAMENHFFWHSSWVGLIVGGKTYFPTLGERWGTGVSHNVSHNTNRLGEGWTAEEVTFYFPLPEGETEFEIAWLCTPAVKGSIKN